MESDISLEEMAKEIKELEAQLTDMKKAYREKKMAGLKSAMEAGIQVIKDDIKNQGRLSSPLSLIPFGI